MSKKDLTEEEIRDIFYKKLLDMEKKSLWLMPKKSVVSILKATIDSKLPNNNVLVNYNIITNIFSFEYKSQKIEITKEAIENKLSFETADEIVNWVKKLDESLNKT